MKTWKCEDCKKGVPNISNVMMYGLNPPDDEDAKKVRFKNFLKGLKHEPKGIDKKSESVVVYPKCGHEIKLEVKEKK